MSDLNLFEAYAETTKPGHERRRERIASKRRENKRIKAAMLEQHQLEKQYRDEVSEGYRELLAGDFGHEIQHLVAFLDRMGMRDGAELVAFIQSCVWLVPAPDEVRHQALHLIGRACTRLRESAGLLPYDDGLPWDQATPAFIQVREIIHGYDQGGPRSLRQGLPEAMGA
jgi:hypothetical protein